MPRRAADHEPNAAAARRAVVAIGVNIAAGDHP